MLTEILFSSLALIICGDCQKEYSDYASACPRCSRPTNLQKNVRNKFPKYWRSKNKLIFEINNKYQSKKESEYKNNYDSSKKSILLIEDDQDMRELIADFLERSGFYVLKAEDAKEGQYRARRDSPDLILMDLMLPNVDGLTLCQRLRKDKRTSKIPILMITVLSGLKDKVSEYNSGADDYISGADDYITKPFDLDELRVRIKVLLRQSINTLLNPQNQKEILNYGPLKLVPERFEAIWFESSFKLTYLEFDLLHCLLQMHGQTVHYGFLLQEVWGYGSYCSDIEMLRVPIRNLRTKLEPDPRKPIYIKNVYGVGYIIDLPSQN